MSAVLVLDANQRSALSVTRSLGRQGVKVICADSADKALAGVSKYCAYYEQYSHPDCPAAFISDVKRIILKHDVKVLYPVSEIAVYTLLENRDSLGGVVLPFPDITVVRSVSDKSKLVQLCHDLDVAVPSSRLYENAAHFGQSNDSCTFPVVLKPTLSRIATSYGWLNTSVTYAYSKEELRQKLDEIPYFREHPFMLQEYISGHGSGVFLLYNRGKCVAHFAHKRLREKPPSGGVSVLSESVEANPMQLDAAKKLLDAVAWHGVAMVEFKVHPNGTPYVMEINPRFWGSLQLAVDAGVDFPIILHRVASDEHVNPIVEYQKGVQLRWLLGDLDRLYLVLKERDCSALVFLRELISFLKPRWLKRRFELNRLDDMKPALRELRVYIKDLFG